MGPRPALQPTCPWTFPRAPQSTSGSPGTPLDMLLQHQHITRSPAMVTPRVESVPSTRLSKPIPRPTSSGVFVTVQGLNMVADSEFSAPQIYLLFPLLSSCVKVKVGNSAISHRPCGAARP